MRILLITLAVAALGLIGTIVWSLYDRGILTMPKPSTNSANISSDVMQLEILKYQIKNEEKINQLQEKLDRLNWVNPVAPSTSNVNTNTGTIQSGNTVEPVKISGQLLFRLLPSIELSLTENKGIYGLYLFETIMRYSTYEDKKTGLIAIPMTLDYNTFLKNMRAVSKDIQTINETTTFPFRSFYVNLTKPDDKVRVVVEFENQAIALQIPKVQFPFLKTLLLKPGTGGTTTVPPTKKTNTPLVTPIKKTSTGTTSTGTSTPRTKTGTLR